MVLGDSLYSDNQSSGQVIEISGTTGQVVTRSANLPTGSLATAGNTLWIAPRQLSTGQALRLIELDPVTLTGPGTVALPATSEGVGGPPLLLAGNSSGLLWAAYGDHLYRVDTAIPAVVAQISTSSQVLGLALDNSGRLYDSLEGFAERVEQRNAATGGLVTSTSNSAIAGSTLTASPAGVWASYRTGMDAAITLYGAGSMTVIGPPSNGSPLGSGPQGSESGPDFYGPMFATATVADGVLWTTTFTNLTCADPDTGAIRATEPDADGNLNVVAVAGGHVYAVNTSENQLSWLTPPAACAL